jgi:hypothetical protein
VLFSDDSVAQVINSNFEPVWQSVRPVPLVHIDFGNGQSLTRTLNGNIATHVCTADGLVMDTIPGIYTPTDYLQQLNQFRLLANYIDQEGKVSRESRLREYHRACATALNAKAVPPHFVNVAPITKARIEGGLKAVLVSGALAVKLGPGSDTDAHKPTVVSPEDLAGWKTLAEDTRLNETVRRLQIHEKLAEEGLLPPERVTRWLYKNVLHADLDDPYLGLGRVLFANYPFGDPVHE